MNFINDNFMLKNETGRRLYHSYAEKMPIIDYHCHLPSKMIADNSKFKDAYEVFLGGDHYKWRQMRAFGIDEEYITGNADGFDKWMKFAEMMPYLIGNPIYHWMALELKRYFDVDMILNKDTAKEIWDICNKKLKGDDFSVRALIKKSNVELICTTDEPYDDLENHKKIKKDFDVRVLPAFRPNLNDTFGKEFLDSMDYFAENGCILSDHSVENLNDDTMEKLVFLGEEYAKRGWIMQLHIGAMRNNNTNMLNKLGVDAGYDSLNDFNVAEKLAKFFDALEKKDMLPKTIIYNLNPKDNAVFATVPGNFQKGPSACKIQYGSGWWYNDNRDGMEGQMKALGNHGILGKFIGMLTDSRSFVAYTRHEYFRRILCNLIGEWVEEGEYPNDEKMLKEIIEGICYKNVKEYFNF